MVAVKAVQTVGSVRVVRRAEGGGWGEGVMVGREGPRGGGGGGTTRPNRPASINQQRHKGRTGEATPPGRAVT